MNKIFVLSALVVGGLAASVAQAETYQVAKIDSEYFLAGHAYGFDAPSGRAWIDLEVSTVVSKDPCFNGPSVPYSMKAASSSMASRPCRPEFRNDTIRAKFPQFAGTVGGLKFDSVSSQIFFFDTETGVKTVCATVVPKTSIWGRRYNKIRWTGDCRVSTKREDGMTTALFETH
jgi:hypothetical protein